MIRIPQTTPEASYRGAENQLYRVEMHDSGIAGTATFKWSRENGSVIFPITNIGTDQITLEHLGRDDRFGFNRVIGLRYLMMMLFCVMRQIRRSKVTAVDQESLQVTLTADEQTKTLLGRIATDLTADGVNKHPYLRRWDQKKDAGEAGVFLVKEGNVEDDWILLEYGVEVQFPELPKEGMYQTGDYWLIPARTATEDVEWPLVSDPDDTDKMIPEALSPQGVEHHYAPLAIITVENGSVKADPTDLRRQLKQGWE